MPSLRETGEKIAAGNKMVQEINKTKQELLVHFLVSLGHGKKLKKRQLPPSRVFCLSKGTKPQGQVVPLPPLEKSRYRSKTPNF